MQGTTIIDPGSGSSTTRVECPKRNWLCNLPASLRPDEVRSLHRMSKQHHRPIRRIVTQAVREAIDHDRKQRER